MTDQQSASVGVERVGADRRPPLTRATRAGDVPGGPVSADSTSDHWPLGLTATQQVIPWALKGIPELASPLAD